MDLVRGLAIVGVVLYHLSWDLGDRGVIPWAVPMGPAGKAFATGLATTFLALVGVSLTLAHARGFRAAPFWRREAKLVVFAVIISVSTYAMYPRAGVFFGILHAIALFSLLCVPLLRAPSWLVLTLAAVVLALPQLVAWEALDPPWGAWTGLAAHNPPTVDLQPLCPRFAATLVGLVLGRWLRDERGTRLLGGLELRDPVARSFVACGRWSLWIYLLHQPLLQGALWVWERVAGGALPVLWH